MYFITWRTLFYIPWWGREHFSRCLHAGPCPSPRMSSKKTAASGPSSCGTWGGFLPWCCKMSLLEWHLKLLDTHLRHWRRIFLTPWMRNFGHGKCQSVAEFHPSCRSCRGQGGGSSFDGGSCEYHPPKPSCQGALRLRSTAIYFTLFIDE